MCPQQPVLPLAQADQAPAHERRRREVEAPLAVVPQQLAAPLCLRGGVERPPVFLDEARLGVRMHRLQRPRKIRPGERGAQYQVALHDPPARLGERHRIDLAVQHGARLVDVHA